MSQMSELTKRLRTIMENNVVEAEESASVPESENIDVIVPQLVLAMDAAGMDPSDKDQQDKFLAMLKLLAGAKKSELMKAMKTYSSSKARKAVKAAKSAI